MADIKMATYIITLVLSAYFSGGKSQETEQLIKIVLVVESMQPEATSWFAAAMRNVESKNPGLKISEAIMPLNRNNDEESYNHLCSVLSSGVSILLDGTWASWERAAEIAMLWGLPLVRCDLTEIQSAITALDQYLDVMNATDAALIFASEMDVDQALYRLIETSNLRVWVHAGLPHGAARMLAAMRPSPSFYAIIGDSAFVAETYKKAVSEKLVKLQMRWNLVLTDLEEHSIEPARLLVLSGALISQNGDDCCKLLELRDSCNCSPGVKVQLYLTAAISHLVDTYLRFDEQSPPLVVDCDREPVSASNATRTRFYRELAESSLSNNESTLYWDEKSSGLYLRSTFNLQLYNDTKRESDIVAEWHAGEDFHLLPEKQLQPVKKFFRIGTTPAIPWTYPKLDPETGQAMFTRDGEPIYEGYCLDFIQKLSEMMNFDYEVVTPKYGTFGRRLPNGSWDGIVGDIMRGEMDFAIAALTMTSEREEVIDFVAPYFEQTGILIVIRKPIRQTSLFKFMTVLRTEVWLSIVGALITTGFMIWLLDKYSPYSARNNPDAYPYPCREFTLKESFWFALTSFTPQGGGEAPKALSGRTLVAAYWLFVVLMLATFTANLAAFLTVERMQTPVASLEQLARQSRINYTVVEGSTVHKYFINMKFAEDTLYRVWKEITLNATADQAQYRVWDYPVREQYGHILLAINDSSPVPNASEGFRQVVEHLDADFAFIHDSAEIKYEITRDCNLTEVGEVFAEQPYAVAVQQGSHLQEQLSHAILDLQKERFLDHLSDKYWNQTLRGMCPDADDNEGITLESLGGVFIATLSGLGLAMITLAWEVFYYKRKEKTQSKVTDLKKDIAKPSKILKPAKNIESRLSKKKNLIKLISKNDKGLMKRVTIGDTFKPVREIEKPNVSYISVFPKQEEFKP